MSGLGPNGLRIIKSTADVLDDVALEAARNRVREQARVEFPRVEMKLKVEQETVHRRPGVEVAHAYLHKDLKRVKAPREGWDLTRMAPGNPEIKKFISQYFPRRE